MVLGFRVVEHAEHDVRDIPAILPEPQASGGHDPVGPDRAHNEVETGEQVNEEISRYARSVVSVVAPPEEASGIEGHFRRITEKRVPIDRFFRGVFGNLVLPRTTRRVPGPEPLGVGEHTDGPVLKKLSRLLVAERTHALTTHLERAAGGSLHVDDIAALVDAVHHRFLTVHGLPGLHCINRYSTMPMVRCGDDHGVDVIASDHLPIIPGGEDIDFHLLVLFALLAPLLFGFLEPPVIQIARRHELYAFDIEGGVDVDRAHAAGTDDRYLDLVVGGALFHTPHQARTRRL